MTSRESTMRQRDGRRAAHQPAGRRAERPRLSSREVLGSWRLERLEDRTMLDGTPITIPQSQAVLDGFRALSALGPKFDSQAALVVQPLDLLVKPAGGSSQPATTLNLAS